MTETMVDNQNLTDEQILEKLQQQDVELPGSDDEGDNAGDDKDKKVRHAFAESKRGRKQAIEIAEKMKKENEELTKKLEQSSSPPPDAGGNQAVNILNSLTMEAMRNLGVNQVTDDNRDLVVMERQRLYNTNVAEIEERKSAETQAPAIIDGVLSDVPQLDDSGISEVKKRLGERDVIQRTDRNVILGEVQKYLGEKILAGETISSSSSASEDETPPNSQESSTASAAAASSVKTGRTGVGVKPGKHVRKSGDAPKPATAEELRTMKELGMTDLAAFRAAQTKKDNYKGR